MFITSRRVFGDIVWRGRQMRNNGVHRDGFRFCVRSIRNSTNFVWRVDLHRIPDGKPPRFPKKPTIRQEGDLLIMECILEAHPVPDITWYQGQKTIADSKRVKMSRKATGKDTYLLTLEISNPTKADGGNYRCNAFNNFGESNANISLNFQGKSPLKRMRGLLLTLRDFYRTSILTSKIIRKIINFLFVNSYGQIKI